jgi:steroid delta-isomerase-like uncharacterized protein
MKTNRLNWMKALLALTLATSLGQARAATDDTLAAPAAQKGGLRSVQFSPDGTRIVTSSNNTVRLWDARTGKPLETIPDQILRNKAITRRYFAEWANRGNAAVADELIATNLVLRNPPAVIRSLEDYKTGMARFHAAFPDARFTIEELIAEGDKVVASWTLRATQATEYQGQAPNGKPMTVTGISIFRLAEGKIQEITVNMDRLGQMEQLGWLPAEAPSSK